MGITLTHRYIEVFKSFPDELRRATNPGRGGGRGGMNRPGPYDRYSGGRGDGFSRGGRGRNSGFERRYGGGGGGNDYQASSFLVCLFYLNAEKTCVCL